MDIDLGSKPDSNFKPTFFEFSCMFKLVMKMLFEIFLPKQKPDLLKNKLNFHVKIIADSNC